MCFVYTQTAGLRRCFILENVLGLGRGIPKACIIDGRDRKVLSDSLDPSRKTFDPLSVR
jgi:hypothetical protein